MMAVAAVIAFLFLPGLQLWIAADVLTDTGELRHVTLDDGSAVHLDAASAIAVRYSASRRDVKLLAGQAYFDVAAAADRPFKVTAEDVAVTVTGTAFNVRLTSRSVSISVRSGAVKVTSKRHPFTASLSPGERLDVDRASGRIARERVAPDDVAAWKDWRLAVDGVTLAEIIEELNRHYKGMIVLQDRALAARRIAGVFDLRRPVDALHAAVSTQKGSVTAFTPYVLVVSGP
jgi:transmembrane sensor